MSVLWAVYASAVAFLLAGAAHVAERGLRLAGRPGRWPWVAALAGSWILPLHVLFRSGAGNAPTSPTPVDVSAVAEVATPVAARSGPATRLLRWLGDAGDRTTEALATLAPDPGAFAAADPRMGLLWLVSSAAGLLLVGTAVLRLRRESRRWPEGRVLGEDVWLSPAFGPAVLGVVRPRIVLPRWVLALGETPLRLVLEHEREHRRARDTLLLSAGALAVLAAPWNPPLWWQLRRLRLAVELDCDRRVLGRGAHAGEYGALLVEVGERVGRVGLPAAALAERSTFLERRLRMITERRTSRWGWRAAGAAVMAAGIVAVACETPAPTVPDHPAPTGPVEVRATAEPGTTAAEPGTAAAEPGSQVAGEPGTAAAGRVDGAPAEAEAESSGASGAGSVLTRRAPFQAVGLPREPLVIVDGVVTDRDPSELAALGIARIEIVKGAAARASYGERARGGVLIVTTDEGASGAASFEPRKPVEAGEPGELRELKRSGGVVRLAPRVGDGTGDGPLLIVDGVITSLDLADIDARDVERIEVVKGPAARALYGERGANGVVSITTKGSG